MNDVRESRLDLLAGINNDIHTLATAPRSALGADIQALRSDIRNLDGALLLEELRTTSPATSTPTTTSTAPITTTSLTAIPTSSQSSIHTIASLSQLPAALPPALSQIQR